MQRTYHLVKPVVAFCQEAAQVVTIPAGTLVELVGVNPRIGIQSASWDGRPIMVFQQDLADNSIGVVPSGVTGDLPHPT
jgi:hypothetical protein